jgi:HK97 family phage portal protein
MSSYGSMDNETVLPTFVSQTQQAYQGNPVVFGVILARLMLFTEATFKYQFLADKHLYGSPALAKLEQPWPNGTTGELLARMEQDTSLAGNAYIWDAGTQLVRLRPDWVTIISEERVDAIGRPYRVPIGYFWDPRLTGDYRLDPQLFTVDEVAHWSPIPDPMANFRGMSWLTPVVREITGDNAMTDYKIQYLNNAATPNILIKYSQKLEPDTIDRLRERWQVRYGGMENAYKTIVLDEGADFTVVGNHFEQMNFTTVQAAGENRIAAAGGVPGIVVGLKEGLQAATYSNYEQAMRRFADLTMRPLWRSACASLTNLIQVPPGSRLWYDTSDIAALRQGEKERAETFQVKADAAGALIRAGYDPDTVGSAIEASDVTLLRHTGLLPVTIQPEQLGPSAPVPALNGQPKQLVLPAASNGAGA